MTPDASDDSRPIEGGSIVDKDLLKISVKGPFDVEKHRGQLTFGLLGLTIVGHYVILAVMEWNGKKVETLNNAFHVALPVISGLAGSAFAYYFTRTNRE